jgi:endonuclease/exonuclease/phosphatase (EEP) superfamily protein YafD
MTMSRIRRFLGGTLVGLSLVLLLFTVFCFSLQPDRFAAFTVMPIWLWGGFGLLFSIAAWCVHGVRLPWILTGLWVFAILVGADETRSLRHLGKPAPLPGPAAAFESKKVIRVITINTGNFAFGDPTADIAAWNPDIVLIQQTMPMNIAQMAGRLYGGRGEFRFNWDNGILTRWKIAREEMNPQLKSQQLTISLPDGSEIEVVNLHLLTATTDLRLWKREAWRVHQGNRKVRRQQLSSTLQMLERTTKFPQIPTILGGDFNAPATDVIHKELGKNLVDAYNEAGTGWGNTFHRRLPVLRIDHLYSTRHLAAVRCRVVESRHSDHRFIVADFIRR